MGLRWPWKKGSDHACASFAPVALVAMTPGRNVSVRGLAGGLAWHLTVHVHRARGAGGIWGSPRSCTVRVCEYKRGGNFFQA